jgi:hypothetical protein
MHRMQALNPKPLDPSMPSHVVCGRGMGMHGMAWDGMGRVSIHLLLALLQLLINQLLGKLIT